jgi:serine/threonine-protein kinase RsbW
MLDVIVSDYGRGIGPSPDTDGPGLGLPLIAALVDVLQIEHAPMAGSRLAMSFAYGPRSGAV